MNQTGDDEGVDTGIGAWGLLSMIIVFGGGTFLCYVAALVAAGAG